MYGVHTQCSLLKGLNMSRVCVLTGKRPRSGKNVSHAHNVAKRTFAPNLQKKRIMIHGKKVRILLRVGIIGFVVVALYLPVFSLVDAIGK